MEILVDNRQTSCAVNLIRLQGKAKVILNALDCPEGELSILLVDDDEIAQLNRDYLKRQGPTNVIAFPMREGQYNEISPNLLGDVVISTETCTKEAQQADITFEMRLDQLLIHGILHLFGYDHVNNEKEALVMETKSAELMARLTIR